MINAGGIANILSNVKLTTGPATAAKAMIAVDRIIIDSYFWIQVFSKPRNTPVKIPVNKENKITPTH
jgi:hypothetical protein